MQRWSICGLVGPDVQRKDEGTIREQRLSHLLVMGCFSVGEHICIPFPGVAEAAETLSAKERQNTYFFSLNQGESYGRVGNVCVLKSESESLHEWLQRCILCESWMSSRVRCFLHRIMIWCSQWCNQKGILDGVRVGVRSLVFKLYAQLHPFSLSVQQRARTHTLNCHCCSSRWLVYRENSSMRHGFLMT